jgi:hypothetical protein
MSFPWKSAWCTKVPKKVALFLDYSFGEDSNRRESNKKRDHFGRLVLYV